MTNLQGDSNVDQPAPGLINRNRGRRITDLDALTKADKARLARRGITPQGLQEREIVIRTLVEREIENGGTLRGTGERKRAAEKFGVTVWTIDNWVSKYKADPRRESLVEAKRGRQPGSQMSKEEEAIICFFYLRGKQLSLGPDDHVVEMKRRTDVRYIYDVLVKFTGFKRSIYSVRRYLKTLSKTDPVAVALARRGKDYMEDSLMPTLPNNVDQPNIRWQVDGRPLPIYINHNGVVCTATLLLMMDDFSQYIVGASLHPRVLLDEEGILKRADFKKGDFGILLASTMRETGIRPLSIYTDNGTQFVALAELLEDLSDTNENLTAMTNSIPGRPRGRGKIERLLGLFDELLQDLPGFVVDEKDFKSINAARRDSNMFSFDRLCVYVQAEIDKLNKQAPRKGGKQTREELWQSMGALPAPPIRKLLRLVPTSRDRDAAISNTGFVLDNDFYEPLITIEEDMWQWLVAVSRSEFVPLRAVQLSHSLQRNKADKGWHVEVCLDREISYWCEGVPRGTQDFTAAKYNEMIGRVRKRAMQESTQKVARLLHTIESFDAERMMKDVITKAPVLAEPEAASSEQLVTPITPISDAATQVTSTPKRIRKTGSSRSQSALIPSNSELNWDEMSDVNELVRRRQISREEGSDT